MVKVKKILTIKKTKKKKKIRIKEEKVKHLMKKNLHQKFNIFWSLV